MHNTHSHNALDDAHNRCTYTSYTTYIQWDLFIKDTLGPANLSTVERLSTLQRWKMY